MLKTGIRCFNVESASELALIEKIAGQLGKVAPISIRINPDVDAKTHPYISTGLKANKFGVSADAAIDLYRVTQDSSSLRPVGIDCHIGSQLTEIEPFIESVSHLRDLVLALGAQGIELTHIDIGGGLGIRYDDEHIPSPKHLISAVRDQLGDLAMELLIEPGRSIVGNAGALLTEVMVIKAGETKHFAVVDAAMNDMLRPSLYQAWMDVQNVGTHVNQQEKIYDVVGPVCESGDFLAKSRQLTVNEGDCLCLFSAGAYGFVMSSNYNSRPRVAEIMVNGDSAFVIRQRETLAELIKGEHLLPEQ